MGTFPVVATSPLPWAVLLVVVLVVSWRRLPRGLRAAGVVIEILLVGLMTPAGSAVLQRAAAAGGAAVRCTAPLPDTVVVIGGGFAHLPRSVRDYGALHLSALNRVFAAVALWRRLPRATLVVAGGAGYGVPEALPMANLAIALGVPATAIRIEERSKTTWENARNVAALAPPVSRRIWLVTSPEHLPRALGAFRAFGFDACPWPSRPQPRVQTRIDSFIPDGASTRRTADALHELLGGWEYRWMEWRHAR